MASPQLNFPPPNYFSTGKVNMDALLIDVLNASNKKMSKKARESHNSD